MYHHCDEHRPLKVFIPSVLLILAIEQPKDPFPNLHPALETFLLQVCDVKSHILRLDVNR